MSHPLRPVFAPASVAVVGASADPTKRGHQILVALREAGFAGSVYPVNPKGGVIAGFPVVPSLGELPEAPALAVICTPAPTVPELVAECGRKGVRAALVLAVGFRESGDEGAALEARLREAVRETGIRVVGPNTSGLLNLPLGLNLIGARDVRPGGLSLLVQSGNMALDLMNQATRSTRDGIRICVGLGNEADVAFHEVLDYLGQDPETRAIIVYLEALEDGPAFVESASRVARAKPVVLIKAARSQAGRMAARSHTGAMAGPYERLRAGLQQAGVVELTRTDELLPVALTLGSQPPAAPGSGVAILSDGGGQGTLAADALSELGVPLAALSEPTRHALGRLLGPAAATQNPVDLAGAADADPRVFAKALDLLQEDPGVGVTLVVGLFGGYALRFSASLAQAEEEAAEAMAAAASRAGKGVVVHSMYAHTWSPSLERLGDAGIPVIESLDTACRCAAELVRRGAVLAKGRWRPLAPVVEAGSDPPTQVGRVLAVARKQGRITLTEPESRVVLGAAGMEFPREALCSSEEEAVATAREWASEVALKVVSPAVSHKSDAGGVALNVPGDDAGAVAAAYNGILSRVHAHLRARDLPPAVVQGVLMTPMQPAPLAELLVGVYRDPDVGPVLSLGAGGIWVEILRDVGHRVLPVEAGEIAALLDELRIGRILAGARGKAPGDREAVVTAALAVARCVSDHPEIHEVEVNPLFVYETGVVPVDARVILGR